MKKLNHPSDLAKLREHLIAGVRPEEKTVVVSSGTCGRARGSLEIIEVFRREIDRLGVGDSVRLEITGCHGFCRMEPNIVIFPEGIFYGNLKPEDIPAVLGETVLRGRILPRLLYEIPGTGQKVERQPDIPFYKKQLQLLTGDQLRIDPTKFEDYIRAGGYEALAKALFEMTADEVIREVIASGLRGRGGGGFPTGKKWKFCRDEPGSPKYIICNADEGNPGTFMDRSLLVANPQSVIEGMIIGAYAIGASEGYIYVRMEAPLAVCHTVLARDQARKWGLLGKSILGSEFHFDIHVVEGAGAYVCGEETSLIASIEGSRASPRQRPPFPAQSGLWGKPTNINNVETWANVPLIIKRGAAWYSAIGSEHSKGTKIISLVGNVKNSGQVEIPMGLSLNELVCDIGGGVPDGRRLKAVQTGGPAGCFIPASMMDVRVDFEGLAQAGSSMGSGGIIVLDDTNCMVDLALHYLRFTQEESCGKCVPCRVGTKEMLEIVERITRGQGEESDLERLEELGRLIKDGSLCGLGQTAPNPVLSTLRHFRDEYIEHIRFKRCPTLTCRDIVSSPCQYACPIGQEASVYVGLIGQGRLKEALEIILKDNPLPGVCGRVCEHPCEEVCAAGVLGEPIAIRALKRYVLDWAEGQGRPRALSFPEQSLAKIAVIGAGPAGLAAAQALRRKGLGVTIFEARDFPGGGLAFVPEFRLPGEVLKRDIEAILEAGVELKTGMALGKDLSIDGLFDLGFKAVFIATGAGKPVKLKLPGEEAKGIFPAVEFLMSRTASAAVGPRVGVIGGDGAAIDAARRAVREKTCKEVRVFFSGKREDLKARKEDVARALEEGVRFEFLVRPLRFRTLRGRVRGIDFRRIDPIMVQPTGRRKGKSDRDPEFNVELETIIFSAGAKPELSFLKKSDGLSVTDRGALVVDKRSGATGKTGVFAGGAVAGHTSLIEALAGGKRAAESIARYVEGLEIPAESRPVRPSVYVSAAEPESRQPHRPERFPFPLAPAKKRTRNRGEVELTYDPDGAREEARRCLRCELRTREGRRAVQSNDD